MAGGPYMNKQRYKYGRQLYSKQGVGYAEVQFLSLLAFCLCILCGFAINELDWYGSCST